jgi:uncharacterized protein YlxW (UPF0749 family)
MKKFITLGTECVEHLKATRVSQGNLLFCALLISSAFSYFFIRVSFPLYVLQNALSMANTRISSLEAELKASRKAFDAAATAKTTAEKSTKSAVARAKKAEKTLADANKERIQQEQAITERLNIMSALAGGKYHAFPLFLLSCPILCLLMRAFSSIFVSLVV